MKKQIIFSGIFGFVLAMLIFIPLLIVENYDNSNGTSVTLEISNESFIESSGYIFNEHTFNHEKTGETYELSETIDNGNHEFIISNNLNDSDSTSSYYYQEIYVGNISRFWFEDVNFDGYTDIVTITDGGLNDLQYIYLWKESSGKFREVECIGFDGLRYFEAYEGYIKNWVKESMQGGVVQMLKWNGDTLVLESAESYEVGL